MPTVISKSQEVEATPVKDESVPEPQASGPQVETPPAENATGSKIPDSSEIDWGEFLDEDDSDENPDDDGSLESADDVTASTDKATAEEPKPGEEPPLTDAQKAEAEAAKTVEAATPAEPGTDKPTDLGLEGKPDAQPKTPEDTAQAELTDEQQRTQHQQLRTEQLSKLSDYYGTHFTEEQAANFMANPQEVVPGMLAQVHLAVLESAVNAIAGMIPNMVSQSLEVKERTKQANSSFFEAWPKLNKPEYQKPLARMIGLYKQNNPEAPLEQLIQEVGASAHIAFKIVPEGAGDSSGGEVVNEPPAGAVPQSGGFRPAKPGGSQPPNPAKKKNEWETMNEEFDAQERAAG